MTQMQLDCQIARITGEPLSTVHRLGFSRRFPISPTISNPRTIQLVLDCPFCRPSGALSRAGRRWLRDAGRVRSLRRLLRVRPGRDLTMSWTSTESPGHRESAIGTATGEHCSRLAELT